MTNRIIIISFSCLLFLCSACKKFVEIAPPRTSITTEAVFVDSAGASTAIVGMYAKMMNVSVVPNFGSGYITLAAGQSADELISFSSNDQSFRQNTLVTDNSSIGSLWNVAYSIIYQANICLEGLESSQTISAGVKKQFVAEAKFVRAFCYFYLINLFGDVPYVTSSDWTKTYGKGRMATATIYSNIITDLLTAREGLPDAYPATGKIRPVKLAASALLARVYLYTKNWQDAAAMATEVISSGVYPQLPALEGAFLKNNDGAIWQLQPINPSYNTLEGYQLIATSLPTYYLDSTLVESFEPGDLRFTNWVKTVVYRDVTYYYAFKYKVRFASVVTENYTMLRLAEQYLIRAEARANNKDIPGAVSDLNVIRQRAGLGDLSESLSPEACSDAVAHERRIELFSEWGHRWLDLKRTGKAGEVLSKIKSTWQSTAVLYPLPLAEMKNDPSLNQNEGYY